MLEWRHDMSEKEQAALMRTFVLPSLKFADAVVDSFGKKAEKGRGVR
jgi:hypothetical protein